MLKALEVIALDEASGFKEVAAALLLEAFEMIELDDTRERKDAVLLLKICAMTELDEVPELRDVLLSLRACEETKLDDSDAVFEVRAAAIGPTTVFTLDPEVSDELWLPVF